MRLRNVYCPLPDDGVQGNAPDTDYVLWEKTLQVPAGYGGNFGFFTTSRGGAWHEMRVDALAANGSVLQSWTVGSSPANFTIPATMLMGTNGSSLRLRIVYTTLGGCCSIDKCSDTFGTVSLDDIYFNSDAPDFVETFDAPFVDCVTSAPNATCHSQYSCENPQNFFWNPAFSGPGQYVVASSVPNQTTQSGSGNRLWVWLPKIYCAARGSDGSIEVSSPDQPYVIWGKTLEVPPGFGGRFSAKTWRNAASASLTGFTVQVLGADDQPIWSAPSGGTNGYATIPASVVSPGSTAATVPLRLRLIYTADYSCCNRPGHASCSGQEAGVIGVDDIAFTSDAAIYSLPNPNVPQGTVCLSGQQANLIVTNAASGVVYNWYKTNNPSDPILHTGTNYHPTVTANDTYYVQAISSGRLGCPSDRVPVMVSIQSVIGSAPTAANPDICSGESTILQVNQVAGFTYAWFDTNGNPLSPTGATYNTGILTSTTDYYVEAYPTASPGCRSPRQKVTVTVYGSGSTLSVAAESGMAPFLKNYQIKFEAAAGYVSYDWNWGDGSPAQTTTGNSATHTFKAGRATPYTVQVTIHGIFGATNRPCSKVVALSVEVQDFLCETVVAPGGTFQRNNRSGSIDYVYTDSECIPDNSLECLGLTIPTISRVVSATATAFADTLVRADATYAGELTGNPFLDGEYQLQPYASYSYRSPAAPNYNNEPNFAAGTFSMLPFNWQSSARARPRVWLPASIAEQVAPNGEVLQERDPLGVPSTAKFGYGLATPWVSSTNPDAHSIATGSTHALPYLQAQNAETGSVLFESFESLYGTGATLYGEDHLLLRATEVSSETAQRHTGSRSAKLLKQGSAGWQLSLKAIPLTNRLRQSGLLVKVWIKTQALTLTSPQVVLANSLTESQSRATAPLRELVRTGEWVLYEARIPAASLNTLVLGENEMLVPRLLLTGTEGNGAALWVDDVRVQPMDAQMTAYVYEPNTFRLLASFDDQHFALLYQYNPEGKLIRKQVETERGVKTVQETHYHTPYQP
ncbi:immunoglobulin domain-containing protein [Hymenobacter lucidus]|uniref:PKD domain-containing protein n=1 Tax=Hymenobacter lucidus TaxID=2880930 RepID=A0ABS8AZC8_9BACT|nr:PKD domain-containing protein [Hymenobacter lucidus]MCB2411147.1 PKD domain-containing protein [Hymenobacter lucidus]